MDINSAKRLLEKENLTYVLFKDHEVHTGSGRGVKPLLSLIDSGKSYEGFSVVDKVVGKAAAFLYVILRVTTIHAEVVSRSALQVLRDNEIAVTYDNLVEYIENRTKDGRCPMESAVIDINDSSEALAAICRKVEELNGERNKHE